MRRVSFLKQLGQTSIEYMLLMAVSVGLGLTATKKIREFLIDNPNSVISKQLNIYKQMWVSDPRYQQYRIPR